MVVGIFIEKIDIILNSKVIGCQLLLKMKMNFLFLIKLAVTTVASMTPPPPSVFVGEEMKNENLKSANSALTNSHPDWADRENPTTLVLFDVDGTLSPSRKTASPEMLKLLLDLKKKVVIGYVGGSDLSKQCEQLGEDAAKSLFDFGFSENGAMAFRKGELIGQESFIGFLGEERYKQFVNWTMRYLANLDIPVKRGTFIEFRNGMVNISPIGRSCSYAERLEFALYDETHNIRQKLVEEYKKEFPHFGLQYSIGGQISLDVFPAGWDKTYCLRHLEGEGFKEIHFFGDKTDVGGNDYELFHHSSVIGHAVKSPEDTDAQVRALFQL